MGIIDSANELKEKINFFDYEIYVLEKQKRERINKIEKETKIKVDACNKNIDYIKNEKKKYDKMIFNASWFDVDKIGIVLANLVSAVENEPYEYYAANYHGTCKYYEEGYGYDTSSINHKVYLISKESNVSYEYDEEYLSEIGSTIFRNKKDMIVLGRGNLVKNRISFYDGMFNKSGLIDVKNYDYIYDFINYLIEYKIENEITELTEEELSNLLNNFLKAYIKGSSMVKKGR